jgi:hypothetical protein
MKVTRLKLWTFRLEFDSGAYTVNRRGRDWCFGPEGGVTTHEAQSLLEVLALGMVLKPLVPQAIDQIVELLVEESLRGGPVPVYDIGRGDDGEPYLRCAKCQRLANSLVLTELGGVCDGCASEMEGNTHDDQERRDNT